MATVQEIFDANQHLLRPVPAFRRLEVCGICKGPVVNGFVNCYGCNQLRAAAPFDLAGTVVPMTTAPNPGPWYTRLATYKTFHPEHRALLVSLTFTYLAEHRENIEDVLGGEFDYLTFVPSTRAGILPETQPLRRTLGMVSALDEHVRVLVRHVPGQVVGRRAYDPDAFACGPDVEGRRIVLIEDTWVTGARAVSAAGALHAAGAESVIIMPMARMVEPGSSYWPADLPYFARVQEPYDLARWPL